MIAPSPPFFLLPTFIFIWLSHNQSMPQCYIQCLLTTHTQISVAVFLYFFPGCEQFFLSLKTPLMLFVCCTPPPSFLYSYFLESLLFCFYCLFSSFLFTIFCDFCPLPSLLLSPLAFSRTRMIPLNTYVTSVSDSPQRSRKKSVWFWYWYPFTLYPLRSTLYPPPAFDASNDDNGHYTYTLYHLRSSLFFNDLHITRIPLLVFWFWFFWFTQTDRLGSSTAIVLILYERALYIYTKSSQVKHFEF